MSAAVVIILVCSSGWFYVAVKDAQAIIAVKNQEYIKEQNKTEQLRKEEYLKEPVSAQDFQKHSSYLDFYYVNTTVNRAPDIIMKIFGERPPYNYIFGICLGGSSLESPMLLLSQLKSAFYSIVKLDSVGTAEYENQIQGSVVAADIFPAKNGSKDVLAFKEGDRKATIFTIENIDKDFKQSEKFSSANADNTELKADFCRDGLFFDKGNKYEAYAVFSDGIKLIEIDKSYDNVRISDIELPFLGKGEYLKQIYPISSELFAVIVSKNDNSQRLVMFTPKGKAILDIDLFSVMAKEMKHDIIITQSEKDMLLIQNNDYKTGSITRIARFDLKGKLLWNKEYTFEGKAYIDGVKSYGKSLLFYGSSAKTKFSDTKLMLMEIDNKGEILNSNTYGTKDMNLTPSYCIFNKNILSVFCKTEQNYDSFSIKSMLCLKLNANKLFEKK